MVLLEADFGDGYAPYPSEPGCEACRVDLPAGRRGSQVALRLTVEDTAGNRLRYEARPAYVVPPIRSYLPLLVVNAEAPQAPTPTEYDLPDPTAYPRFIADGLQEAKSSR